MDDGNSLFGIVKAIGLAAPSTPTTSNGFFVIQPYWQPYGMPVPSVYNGVHALGDPSPTLNNNCIHEHLNPAPAPPDDKYNVDATQGGHDPSCALAIRFN